MKKLVDLIDDSLLEPEQPDPRYENSPFRFIKPMHAKQKGKRFEKITECVCKKKGLKVQKPESSDHDRIINNEKCEIKGATLVKGKEVFSFLQIRPDQDYDKMLFSMFYPDDLVILQMTKKQVIKLVDNGTFKKQHGGNKAESGTYCYYGNRETLLTLGAKEFIRD